MIHLDTLSTLVAATLVLLLGRKLVHSVSLLKKYTIPEPVFCFCAIGCASGDSMVLTDIGGNPTVEKRAFYLTTW